MKFAILQVESDEVRDSSGEILAVQDSSSEDCCSSRFFNGRVLTISITGHSSPFGPHPHRHHLSTRLFTAHTSIQTHIVRLTYVHRKLTYDALLCSTKESIAKQTKCDIRAAKPEECLVWQLSIPFKVFLNPLIIFQLISFFSCISRGGGGKLLGGHRNYVSGAHQPTSCWSCYGMQL